LIKEDFEDVNETELSQDSRFYLWSFVMMLFHNHKEFSVQLSNT